MEVHFSGNVMCKPYIDDIIDENTKIRTFDPNVDQSEMVWHRDKKDRNIEIIDGLGWYFQMDNNIPMELKIGDKLFVPKGEYHRIYKVGTNQLKINIRE